MESIQNRYENWINNNKFTSWMNSFINSEWFIVLSGIIILISNCFAQEVICFTLIAILASISLFFSKDTKSIIFMLLTLNMGMSYKNGISYNPNPELPNIYDNKNIIAYFYFLGGLVIISAIYNFIIFKQYKNKCDHILYLLPTLILLGIGYSLGGSSTNHNINNVVFGSSNALMIIGIYFYFSLTAFENKDVSPINYISKIMCYSSLLICLELLHIYLTNDVIKGLTIYKQNIKNGWAISNNFAGYLNMFYPFILYLLLKEKNNLIYYLFLFINIIATISTLSRNGYIVLFIEVILSIILILYFRKKHRIQLSILILISLISFSAICYIYRAQLAELFKEIIKLGASLHGREELYIKAWDSFIKSPLFGEGWFIFDINGSFIPPTSFAPNYKAHNFILQLLGSTGIFGFICFLLLILSIFYFSLKNKSKEKIVYLIGVITLLSTSVLDNFFFDYGFEKYFAIFLVGIAIALKEEKEHIKDIDSKEAIVNE